MKNRFYASRTRAAAIVACVFVAACCAVGVQAASVSSETFATGEYIAGYSGITWQVSNGNLMGIPPLCNGQEVTTGSYTDQVASGRGGSYSAKNTLNQPDLITQTNQREVILNSGHFSESLFYYDVTAPGAGGASCSIDAPGAENTTANNEMAEFSTSSFGNIKYLSIGGVSVGDSLIPDTLEFTAQASGNGGSAMQFNAFSQAGLGNVTAMGYQNSISERITAGGNGFTIGKSIKWTSFRNTFDGLTAEGTV